ncbi:MAG: glycoside hydrolase family 13 protein [Termitinemataceae bacterium]|nr:MAG: glycoside hydrolase family 13 protein [Termitinemataceae bacterium]
MPFEHTYNTMIRGSGLAAPNRTKPVGVQHKASLPYCCYDKIRNVIDLRLVAPNEIEEVVLIYGDPYDYGEPGDQNDGCWQFSELPLYRQFEGVSDKTVWKIELAVPPLRRIKYGFRLKQGSDLWYFSENGTQPFSKEDIVKYPPHCYFFLPYVHGVDYPDYPSWVGDTVWYQIFPDRFCHIEGASKGVKTADNENGTLTHGCFFGGNLAGIQQNLDYIKELGISGIYLTPIFSSPSNHKYNTEDYFTIDEHFGDLSQMKALVAACHDRGIRVMLDAVFNHAGDSHPFWQDVLEHQEKSIYKDYFHIHRFPVSGSPKNREELTYDTFSYSSHMPKWNTEHPNVRKHLLDAASYWIKELDIDGWRLDVANEVSIDFWLAFSCLVRSLKKDFYILGEIWHDASNWIDRGCFDAVMNYPMGQAISCFFLKKDTTIQQFNESILASLTRYSDLHNRLSFNLLDSHDTDRALTRAGGDKRLLRNAFTMLFLLPGSPCIYYGTEVGMEGGGDPDCRRPMIWDNSKQDADMLRFFHDLIDFRKKYVSLLNNSTFRYQTGDNGEHYWEFLSGKYALLAVYTEEKTLNKKLEGMIIFDTVHGARHSEMSAIPPYTMAIYSIKKTAAEPSPQNKARAEGVFVIP